MIEWWQNLGQEIPAHASGLKVFYTIGIVSGAILTIQMVMSLLGGDTDFEIDGMDVGEDGGTGLFSIRSVGAFFTGFGWTGVAMLQHGYDTGVATFTATLVGLVFLGMVIYLMRYIFSLREEGTMNYANAVGEIGTVYLPIPPNRKGLGQIEVLVQGRMRTVRALSDHDKKLGNRVAVRVKELVDQQTLLVECLETENKDDPTD
ncbi:MAG: hypothetical protein VB980_00740 [Opitutales bacterium]|mgnify:CR=1 FL=1|jgi:hypothetical protein